MVEKIAYDDVARRYRTLVEQLPLVVYVDALDAASSNIFTSSQVEALLGYSPAEWLADSDLFVRVLHPEDRDRVLAAHARTHATLDPLSVEYRLIARDGAVVWVRDEGVIVFDDEERPLYLQGYLLNITPEREAQAQLRQLALYDALTGLANRAFFHEQFQHTVSMRKDPALQTALLFMDLNDFKNVNDRWGHDVGDHVLATLGARVQDTLRAGDSAARLGGDEFAIVIPSIAEPAEAVRVADRLLEAIRAPIEHSRRQLTVNASIGIAVGDDVERMLQEADAAMYRAKRQQDVGYAFYDPELDTAAVQRSRRVIELREAVELGQFTLDYQPVIDLEAYEIAGYEALLRWQHPTEGEVAPLEFIPLAEESGLIVPLGKWVLSEACRYGAMLQADMGREIGMAVNVSARQLQHPDFVSHVEQALAESGFPPHCLTLELTESVLLASGDSHGSTPRRAEAERHLARARRFRHRLRIAFLSAALPGRHREDRPQLHRHDRDRQGGSGAVEGNRRSRQRARAQSGCGGNPDSRAARDRSRPRLPQRAGLLLRLPEARSGAQARRRSGAERRHSLRVASASSRYAGASRSSLQLSRSLPRTSGERGAPSVRTAVFSTFPPRACGIGTFSFDVRKALLDVHDVEDVCAIVVVDQPSAPQRPDILQTVSQGARGDYVRAASGLARTDVDVVLLQHEYGIFGGRDGEYVLSFARELAQPLVVTLHTVLSSPTPHQLARRSQRSATRPSS